MRNRFDRERLIAGLPAYQEATEACNEQVKAYLDYYQLSPLLVHAQPRTRTKIQYRIGAMTLDGCRVTVQSFSQIPARGTVIIMHGYMDHLGLYGHLIGALLNAGYNVLGYDLSGHGLSDGMPLAVDDFQHYARQLQALLTELGPGLQGPVHLVGQSTGAAIIMTQQRLFPEQGGFDIGERVLLAPLVRPCWWRSIQRKFRWFRFVLRRVPRRFSQNSHDPHFIRFLNEEDCLQHREIPLSWIGAMLKWGDWFEAQDAQAGALHVIQGTDDGTVDWRHNLLVLERLYPQLRLLLVRGAKHHLVNESEAYREQVFEQLLGSLSGAVNKNGQPEAARI